MKKLLLFLTMLIFCGFSAYGQRTVTGTVADETGEVLIGANILVKGTTVGTVTDLDGKFSLQVPSDNSILVISYTGYGTMEMNVGSQSNLSVTMVEGEILSEVVVTGYGSQKKTDISGSISKVEGERLQGKAVAGIDGALQGEVSGLLLTSNNGQPGGGMTVRIRGNSSINAGNEPLYVIDGIAVTTGDFSSTYYGGMDFNAISDLNPSDIESVEVLKDAAASSIYGSRASNGVILITTKRGSAGTPKISFGYSRGSQTELKRWDMLDGEQYSELRGIDWNGKNTDFMEAIYQDAPVSQYDLSIQGGDLKTKYFIGGSYFDQEGTILNQFYDRLSGRFNFDHSVSDKLSIGTSISLSNAETNVVISDNAIYGALSLAILQPQNVDLYNEDGTYNFTGMFFENPVATALEKDLILTNNRTLANVFARYRITDDLTFQTKVGIDKLDFEERSYFPANTSQGAGSNGSANLNTTSANRTVVQNTLEYNTKLNKIGLGVLAGVDYENYDVNSASLAGSGFPSIDFRYLASAAEFTDASQSLTGNRLLSFYGRANVVISDKYLLTGTFRADGSSKFGENNQYGYFPSASFGWRISNEDFLKGSSLINDLKLRLSYGLTGNQAGIGNFDSRGLSGGGANYNGLPGVAPSSLPNPDLRWEETREFNVGLDFSIIGNKIGGSIEVYNKLTKDVLLNRPLPPSSGFSSITQNVGEISNKGIELGLNTNIIDRAFKWSIDVLVSKNVNLVETLYEGQGFDAGFLNRVDEGLPLAYFYGWKAEKNVDPATGDVIYEDVNGDGNINADDFQFIGSPHPDYIGSVTNTISYKGISLRGFFTFVQGNEVLNYTRVFNEDGLRRGFNNNTNVLNAWKNEGDITSVPRFGGENATRNNNGARFIEDGSYFRLKTLTLSYDVTKSLLDQIGFSNLQVYVAGENLFTLTDYTGLDPETNYAGTDNLALGTDFLTQGLNRTIKFGIRGTF